MTPEPVRVSMYNVGFGDCFLIRFPTPVGERRVLIDCGSIKKGIPGGTDAIVERLIADVTDDDVARIDVVVASHRHKDHVSGFDNPAWRNVVVDEVWLPWTENPQDEKAVRILTDMAGFADGLRRELQGLTGLTDPERELIDHVIGNTLELSNEGAMATLHRGFSGGTQGAERKFLSRSPDPLNSSALPGVAIHLLGPSTDENVIRDMNPPSDESFLRVGGGGSPTNGGERLPFDAVPAWSEVPTELTERLQRMSVESAVLGAVALEKAVNNTSLMLAFELGEAVLLFPGDAQWGAWSVNLEDPATKALMERTRFYKVGHHGSHNATPKTFVKHVLQGHEVATVCAAASVAPHGRFNDIPKATLLKDLRDKIGDRQVTRSDEPPADADAVDGRSVVSDDEEGSIRIDFEIPVV